MSAHTPGPWFVVDHHVANRYYVSVRHADASIGAASWDVARVTVRATWRDEQLANAHLIAAAPELLEALREALIGLGMMLSYHGQGSQDYADAAQVRAQDAYDAARAAIAKATGETA